MNTENIQHRQYLQEYWDVVAAIAWREFNVHGRGALVVQDFEQPDEDAAFVPLAMLNDSPLGDDYAAFVREYDPQREVVVIFLRPPCLVSAYKGSVAGGMTPPEAYWRLRDVLAGIA